VLGSELWEARAYVRFAVALFTAVALEFAPALMPANVQAKPHDALSVQIPVAGTVMLPTGAPGSFAAPSRC
jgi:hypothetical protein